MKFIINSTYKYCDIVKSYLIDNKYIDVKYICELQPIVEDIKRELNENVNLEINFLNNTITIK
jgi:hypothetical protein